VIRAYLQDLERALSFDRALARRVCQEAEVHLLEAIAADPTADRSEAQRNAIASFGDPKEIAKEFAGVFLARQARGMASTVVFILFGVFLAMKVRVEWYALTHWTMRADRKSIAEIVLSIDRYAFWTSVLLGVAVYFYMHRRSVLAGPTRSDRRTYNVCVIATATLAVSVVADGVLTGLQLHGTQLCSSAILPLLSSILEVAAVSFLGIRVLLLVQRARSTASLRAS